MRVVTGRPNATSVFGLAVALCVTAASWAQGPTANPEDLEGVLRTLQAPGATEAPTIVQGEDGFLRYLGAPVGGVFGARQPASKAAGPEGTAAAFLADHAAAFGVAQPDTTFNTGTVREQLGDTFVRLEQSYSGIPVFGAQAAVQLTADGNVRNVLSDVLRDTADLDSGVTPIAPAIAEAQAIAAAKQVVADAVDGVATAHLSSQGTPSLYIWSPAVVGLEGPTRLVWKTTIVAVFPQLVRQVVFVDAQSGTVVYQYSLVQDALNRDIRDADGVFETPELTARQEGQAAVGIRDIDNAYDFLGDTYNFYRDEHDYDSYDDNGSTIQAVVRLPFANASWTPATEELAFGAGWATDDMVGHEFTHGVTQFTSDLIYFGLSGAINEAFSDMWGEWIDLTNGAGNDSDDVRWFIGEDITENKSAKGIDEVDIPDGAIRSMKDPTLFGDPDRLGSSLLISPFSIFDNGGVHINSGIGNKLAYLLTDGGSFNGQTVDGMGISRTADLFFATQFILTPAADYFDLFAAMNAAATSLGFSLQERINIVNAADAVEIVPSLFTETVVTEFQATPTRDLDDNPVIALTWDNPSVEFFNSVTLLRSVTGFITNPIDGVELYNGKAAEFLDDQNLVEGIDYYYTLIAELAGGVPQVLYARATAGVEAPNVPVEAFGDDLADIDLAFSQLTYTPVGSAQGAGGYDDYDVTIQPGVFGLPIARQDQDGNAFDLPLTDEGYYVFTLGGDPFPFFGELQSQLVMYANGNITFDAFDSSSVLNTPTLDSHYAVERISLLFSNLAPNAGGSIWARSLPDRTVLTYENILEYIVDPGFGSPAPSTAQVELFHNGTIRMTFQDLAVENAIVGISNGSGVPVDPADRFEDIQSVTRDADLSEFPDTPQRLRFNPLTINRRFDAGDRIAFTVTTTNGENLPGVPVLFASWDGVGIPPFADLGNGSGQFEWQTTVDDAGIYTLRVNAQLGDERATIAIRLIVGSVLQGPEATNLSLATGTALENPFISRVVADEVPLIADYTYSHPLGIPEGPSILYWFRNGLVLPSFTGARQISAAATRPGDLWHYRVAPVDSFFVFGTTAISPFVTINGSPTITSVAPSFGSVEGGETVTIQGLRLNGTSEVTFGGVKAQKIRTISPGVIEVETPRFPAGTVQVVVKTSVGTGMLNNAYTYLDEDGFKFADVNRDGVVDATDVQLVIAAVLQSGNAKANLNTDINADGSTNSGDIQVVVNEALHR